MFSYFAFTLGKKKLLELSSAFYQDKREESQLRKDHINILYHLIQIILCFRGISMSITFMVGKHQQNDLERLS